MGDYMIAVRVNSPNGPCTHRAWNNRAAEADAFGRALIRLMGIVPAIRGVEVYDLKRDNYRLKAGEELDA